MYIKEIEINYFKSFYGHHKIPFNGKFIVVTGPNGSGKSNILDAIRWVIGEQRSKLLRVEKSEEVIFGGNKNLAPAKYAEVSLHLLINSGFAFDTYIITRRIERDGDSAYFLNDKNIRLKDLQIFLSSCGVGKHNLTFIGQGELESLILDNDRLKEYLEDIAGISGYQEKVKETQLKLDIIEAKGKEIEEKRRMLWENLEELRKEAKLAEYYTELTKELEKVRESLNYYQWQKLYKNIEEINENLRIFKDEFSGIEIELENMRKEEEEINSKIKDLNRELENIKSILVENQIKREKLLQRISDFDDRKKKLEKEILESNKELEVNKEELKNVEQNLIEEEEENYLELGRKLRDIETNLKEKEIIKARYEEKLKNFHEVSNVSEEFAKWFIQRLKQKREKLEEYKNYISKELREKESLIRAKERYLDEKVFELQRERRLLRDLEDIQRDSLPKGVREILALKDNNVLGIVLDILQIDKDYLTPIFNILGNTLFDIIVTDEYTAERLIRYLRDNNLGWATFRPLSFYKDFKERIIEIKDGIRALNVVNYDERFKELVYSLLGNVLIFKDFETALSKRELLKEGWRLVTLKGEVFLGSGTISGGVRNNIQTTLNININMHEREENIKELSQAISILESDIKTLRVEKTILENKREKLDNLLKKIDSKLEFYGNVGLFEEYRRILEEFSYLRNEWESIKDKYEKLRENFIYNRNRREFLGTLVKDLQNKIEEMKKEKDFIDKEYANMTRNLEDINKEIDDGLLKEENLRSEINSLTERLVHLKEVKEKLINRRQQIREEIIRSETNLQQIVKRKEEIEKDFENKNPNLKIDLPESKLRAREKEILKTLENLGPINFLAKEKLNAEEEKYRELTEQWEDVYESISSLRSIIKSTLREAETRFLNAYSVLKDLANNNWKMFFPHGDLQILLEKEQDPLNSNIYIKLTSNKKNYKSLLMLSGGEKSITALSLLLAGLEIAPVNFCFWDEIDSALDNHNAHVLGKKIKEMSKSIQFILISHNPTLMEYAETLYGVTIDERGSTQVLTWRLEGEVVNN